MGHLTSFKLLTGSRYFYRYFHLNYFKELMIYHERQFNTVDCFKCRINRVIKLKDNSDSGVGGV